MKIYYWRFRMFLKNVNLGQWVMCTLRRKHNDYWYEFGYPFYVTPVLVCQQCHRVKEHNIDQTA